MNFLGFILHEDIKLSPRRKGCHHPSQLVIINPINQTGYHLINYSFSVASLHLSF